MCQTPQSNGIYSWDVRMVEQPQINKYTHIKKLKVKNHMIVSIYAEKYLTFFFFFNFILPYNSVLVLPYINMNPPRVYTCSPSWIHLPPHSPIPSLWVIPEHQPQASCIMHQTWTVDSFHIWYYTCFNAILPNHPILSLSHRVQKTVLYICVSFAVLHTGLLLPSF